MFKQQDSALIVIDVQGRLAHLMHKKKRLFKQLKIMIKAAQILELPIFWLEQYPQGLGRTIPEISELLDDYPLIEKNSFSACGAAEFIIKLNDCKKNQLIITGIEAHVCVYQTVRDLLQADFKVAINQDAISSRVKSNKKLALHRMQQAGATLTSTEMILFEIMQTAKHPEFKKISNLLK
ncbi:MAG: hydrolase [Proteobacteria bacterium]|nr:hydrolase [Pseudomonadota bacterium]